MRESAQAYLNRTQDMWKQENNIEFMSEVQIVSYITSLKRRRNRLNKELFAEQKKEATERARKKDRANMITALRGGSVKRSLLTTDRMVLPPLAVENVEGELLVEPEDVKEETLRYFENLYTKPLAPTCPKPWMDTQSVREVRAKVAQNPFEWPQRMTMSQFKGMLQKGNARPSPGPDGWEKWMVKRLPDPILEIVMDLINYILDTSSCPQSVKSMSINLIHKKGSRTSLSNWRAVTFSNFILNAPATWLNYKLLPYCVEMGIIPQTQVATQQGTQTRDLTSFLSQVECWAHRKQQTLYILKRDQMKGFDYLAPQGFYDAIEAYGLPSSIAMLDRSLQHRVKTVARTAYGLTRPFEVDGVTKQGGPLSPLKSTLTTSMMHRMLIDDAKADNHLINITSSQYKNEHTPDDCLELPLAVAEATDDSFIISGSMESLSSQTIKAERFQSCYNWKTSWAKSLLIVLNPRGSDRPQSASLPSVDPEHLFDETKTTMHDVEVVYDHCVFLGVKINDSVDRFNELLQFIETFPFPKLTDRLPHNVIKRIVTGAIVPVVRALLTLQPILTRQASELDRALSKRVHEMLGFRFPPKSAILSLPVDLYGLGFPSFTRMNHAICLEGMMRDLNHHVEAYKVMARITMADWTCAINGCWSPLSNKGARQRNYEGHASYMAKIPVHWLVAHTTLGKLPKGAQVIPTDQSFIREGRCHVVHVINCSRKAIDSGTSTNISSWKVSTTYLQRHGISHMHQLGHWNAAGNFVWDNPPYPTTVVSPSARRTFEKHLQNLSILMEPIKLSDITVGDPSLTVGRDERRSKAIRTIKAWAKRNPRPLSSNTWATDGSMRPAPVQLHESRVVTAAVTGPKLLVALLPSRASTILHGEILALVMARILSGDELETRIVTDHMNSVNFLKWSMAAKEDKWLRKTNGRSYYRWYLSLNAQTSIIPEHVKAHTDRNDLDSMMNAMADDAARASSIRPLGTLLAPVPTFDMDEHMLHTQQDGYIESSLFKYVDHFLALAQADSVDIASSLRMARLLYDKNSPPGYPYTRAVSSYSATVQLYARSGQLDTMSTRFLRKLDSSPRCDQACGMIQTDHHIFVECPSHAELRKKATEEVIGMMEKTAERFKCVENLDRMQNFAGNLFTDSDIWPMGKSVYYLGRIPSLLTVIPDSQTNSFGRARHLLSTNLHSISVRLAGRVWGSVMRERTRRWREELGGHRASAW